jgi:hypothetical protein
MKKLQRRFAKVLHTVTIEVQVDLATRDVFQVLVDHTSPLVVSPGADLPAAEAKDALAIAERSLASWPDWAVPGGHLPRPPIDPKASPPF